MVSFEGFKPVGSEPIYLQIVDFIKRGIVSGEIPDGDELPSRRALSALLCVNPNTVQKACRLLEDEGMLASRAGAKSFVVWTPELRSRLARELTAAGVSEAALKLKRMGLTLDEAIELISRAWEEES